jgi:hypothetical protein
MNYMFYEYKLWKNFYILILDYMFLSISFILFSFLENKEHGYESFAETRIKVWRDGSKVSFS